MIEQTNFNKQWYKYNFAELLYEYLYSDHKYVKYFFLNKYWSYNSYIRTRTKWRYNLKTIIINREFWLWRASAVRNHLECPLIQWERCRDPYTMSYIRDLSSPEAISRRRIVKRRTKYFFWMYKTLNMVIKMTWTDDLFVEYIRSLSKLEHAKWCETRDMFTEFQSLYDWRVMQHWTCYM
jgi:hypothetical protein